MQLVPYKRIHFDTIESTHLYAYSLPCAPYITFITANHQTGGVGQYANAFYDTNGSLLFSCIIPKSIIHQPDLLAAPSSIALNVYKLLISMLDGLFYSWLTTARSSGTFHNAPRSSADEQLARNNTIWVKKPNDLYIAGEKCGGALTVVKEKSIILSIGVNIESAPALPKAAPYSATYLNKHLAAATSIRSIQSMIEQALCMLLDVQLIS